MKNLILTFSMLLLITIINAQERFAVRITNPGKEDYKEFLIKGYDVAAYRPRVFIDLVVNNQEYKDLEFLGFSMSITQTEEQLKNNLVVGKALNGYRTYEDLLLELQQIEATNPSICKLYDIGNSRGKEYLNGGNSNYINYNHEIWALKLSDNVNIEEDEPYVYYMGEHHAREPISLEVNMYILNYLVSNYGTDPDVTDWVNNTQIWFMPLVNPNGHKIVTDEDDLWWRKNIRDNNGNGVLDIPGGSYPDGVDPNRNYGWHWGGTGSSNDPNSETYHGPTAFSEPNIQAMKNIIDNYHFVTGITYHSYSELVLFPYGYDNNTVAPDHDALEELAIDMAVTIPATSTPSGHYTPQESWQLYPASGTTDDYSYGKRGIFSYTVELGTEFIPPANEIPGICQDNLQAALILLDRVNHSTLTGIIRDANTNQPIVAEVYIDGIDNTGEFREPYESDVDFGRYYRLLMDGNYSVTYLAYGYIPQTFNSVNINNSGQTILDVYLVPAQTVTVTGTVTDFDTGLPIENSTIEILDTPLLPVTTNQDGEYTIENIMEGSYDFMVYAAGYITTVEEVNVVNNSVFDFALEEITTWCFESGVFEQNWLFGGNLPWTITSTNAYEGSYCSKSGTITHNQTSEMEIGFYPPYDGVISFFRKVSSEASWDFLKFYIDGILQDEWSGETSWAEVTFPVSPGNHTFKWIYSKDSNTSNGSDCAWVDCVQFFGFPEIEITPLNFNVTLEQNESTTKQLSISNLGEQALSYNIIKQYQTDKSKAYCSASGGCDEYISHVIFNTIDNLSGCSNYADYTSFSTNVNAGQTYSLTIENGNVYSSDDLGVWIDWNQDQDFEDAGENVVCESSNNGQGTFSITVPTDALSGSTVMRIRIKYSGTDCGSPCGTTSYGEVEDYTLIISGLNDWLTIVPISGSVPGQDTENIDLTCNSSDLEEGDYYANIIINSNDPDQPETIIPVHLIVSGTRYVDIKAFLEGPFTGTEMTTLLNVSGDLPLNQPYNVSPWNYAGTESVSSIPTTDIVDWILVEFRDTTDATLASSETIIARQAAFLLKDGSVVGLDGFNMLNFTATINDGLYVVVWHRNHLGVISANALIESVGIYTYDFSSGSGQAYGGASAQKNIGGSGIWGIMSGDGNGDGGIGSADKLNVWNVQTGEAGYKAGDFNLDGQVNNPDKDDYWVPNFGAGSFIPE